MATKEKRKVELRVLVRSLGGTPVRVAPSSADLAQQASELGMAIYRETMHGKIKLTVDA